MNKQTTGFCKICHRYTVHEKINEMYRCVNHIERKKCHYCEDKHSIKSVHCELCNVYFCSEECWSNSNCNDSKFTEYYKTRKKNETI